MLGYFIVGLFLFGWALSVAVWKFGRLEERYGGGAPHSHVHDHAHGNGTDVTHSHTHVH